MGLCDHVAAKSTVEKGGAKDFVQQLIKHPYIKELVSDACLSTILAVQ